jgi:hypothetical protein
MFSLISKASAVGICAEIVVDNTTDSQFSISASVDGTWVTAPPGTLNTNQTIQFLSCSNGGLLPTGTGGSLTISTVGTLTWSAPWSVANGLGGSCDGHTNDAEGNIFPGGTLNTGNFSMGPGGPGGEWTCLFRFSVTPYIATRSFQPLSEQFADQIFVLGTDRKLWLERSPFWQRSSSADTSRW